MEKQLTPQEEQELADKIKAQIDKLNNESFAIDLCRGKGITLDKSHEIGDRQREIEKELSQLKTKKPNSEPNPEASVATDDDSKENDE